MYGGLIENTWLDRPLGAAGTVVLKGDNAFDVDAVLVDTKRPIAIVPNLAIHMNRSVNDGVKLNRQKEMLPIMMMDRKKDDNGARGFVDNRNPSLFPDTNDQYDEWSTFF